ncbi:signal peptidase II [Thermogemmatispora tikiterensis]|uniref:Lipoprotein signal peptidase n=1 Tax=Thermogemmatispora tikiterensis TaxID=1825093 RepID=A0A328VA73_9CHLR|nr:signal peptidase II [Thermogemmatispora tikiterensis]RAQ94566.1 signal peptidase II [Thermogemmatispora tikiterensis]
MSARRARLYDLLALLVMVLVVALDQWTKALVVSYLSPPDSGRVVPLLGEYLSLYYTRNSGAAFGLFANSVVLAGLIAVAVAVVITLYLRGLNSGPLSYKLVFGLIIGGAVGNLIDRVRHGGYVVDFILFRIPQIGFRFAVFNLADSAITVGVILLLLLMVTGALPRTSGSAEQSPRRGTTEVEIERAPTEQTATSPTLRPGQPPANSHR